MVTNSTYIGEHALVQGLERGCSKQIYPSFRFLAQSYLKVLKRNKATPFSALVEEYGTNLSYLVANGQANLVTCIKKMDIHGLDTCKADHE